MCWDWVWRGDGGGKEGVGGGWWRGGIWMDGLRFNFGLLLCCLLFVVCCCCLLLFRYCECVGGRTAFGACSVVKGDRNSFLGHCIVEDRGGSVAKVGHNGSCGSLCHHRSSRCRRPKHNRDLPFTHCETCGPLSALSVWSLEFGVTVDSVGHCRALSAFTERHCSLGGRERERMALIHRQWWVEPEEGW